MNLVVSHPSRRVLCSAICEGWGFYPKRHCAKMKIICSTLVIGFVTSFIFKISILAAIALLILCVILLFAFIVVFKKAFESLFSEFGDDA